MPSLNSILVFVPYSFIQNLSVNKRLKSPFSAHDHITNSFDHILLSVCAADPKNASIQSDLSNVETERYVHADLERLS